MERQETADLLRRAREGATAAQDALFRRYAGKLLALIRVRMGRDLRGQMDSQDILQSCLLKSFERIDQFERSDSGSLMAWLARIAENEIHDQRERHRRARRDLRRTVPLDEAATALATSVRSAVSQIILDERAVSLERALDTLPEHYREVIVLRQLEELSWSEVAGRLGKSDDACRMLMARAMAALTLAMADLQ